MFPLAVIFVAFLSIQLEEEKIRDGDSQMVVSHLDKTWCESACQ